MIHLFHRWIGVSVYHYVDTSFNTRIKSTAVTLKCKICGKLKEQHLYGVGYVTLNEINKISEKA